MKTTQFGLHLTLDLYNCNQKKLNDMEICYKALKKLPSSIGMQEIMPPVIIGAGSNENKGGKDPGGYSGFSIIAESHISLHTFVNRGFVSIDAYSCKEFDTSYVIDYFKKIFESDDAEVNVIKRGTRYPTENIH